MRITPRVLWLFVDGIGLGPDEPGSNPLAVAHLPAFRELLGTRPVLAPGQAAQPPLWALDACLGVPGLPQSGTGQVALLTGVNAPRLAEGHFGPYPPLPLRDLLAERSLWVVLTRAGRSVAFANAFPDRYLDRARRGTARMGAIARSAWQAGVRLRGPDDLRRGEAASAFLTNAGWREQLGYDDMPQIDEATAGAQVVEIAVAHDFTVFEFYASDIQGHRGGLDEACRMLEAYDRFLAGVLAGWSPEDVLVVASDHGNVEDLGTTRHTRNPALGAWLGPGPERPLAAITDVAPAILAALGVTPPEPA